MKKAIPLFLAALAAAGCAQSPPLRKRATRVTREEFLKEISIRNAFGAAVQMDIQLRLESPHEKPFSFHAKLLWGGDGKMRLKARKPPLPSTLFEIAADGRTLWVHLPSERRFLRGDYGAPIPELEGITAPDILSALFPFLSVPAASGVALLWEEEEGFCILYAAEGQGEERRLKLKEKIWIGPEGRILQVKRFDREGRPALVSAAMDYRPVPGLPHPLPRRILLLSPKTGVQLTARVAKIAARNAAPERAFSLRPPEGVPAERLSGGSGP